MKSQYRIGVVGLGYVGLPLAVAFSKNYDVVGFDINPSRISELRDGIDLTLEVESEEIKNNNVAVAIISGVIIISISLIVNDSLYFLLDTFVPYPDNPRLQ